MVDGFKVYMDGNREYFEWKADKGKKTVKADYPFTQSLLDFLDLDMDGYFDTFNAMGKIVQEMHGNKTGNIADLRSALDDIAEKHVYFQFLRLEWLEKLEDYEGGRYECSVYDFLPLKALTHIPMNIIDMQHQIKYMIEKALSVADGAKDSIKERVASLYFG
jgi:hypothetical protein